MFSHDQRISEAWLEIIFVRHNTLFYSVVMMHKNQYCGKTVLNRPMNMTFIFLFLGGKVFYRNWS